MAILGYFWQFWDKKRAETTEFQRFLLSQKADELGPAVSLFAVVQHRLGEDDKVFGRHAGDAQSKFCALQ